MPIVASKKKSGLFIAVVRYLDYLTFLARNQNRYERPGPTKRQNLGMASMALIKED